ncbi:MAG: DUF47 family protein [Spirochaetes bacterium]|nr:DUF47 family protein [Spirochaetota bacterium]
MQPLFSKTRRLINEIDNFLDLASQTGLHLREGIRLYIEQRYDEFEQRLETIRNAEKRADASRIDVEASLYTETLIPESRGDVLGILESMDSIVDKAKKTMLNLSIERPVIPARLKPVFLELTDRVIETVEELVSAARAYFYELHAVKDHLHKVKYFEREADHMAEKIKREVFSMKIDLARKIQLSYFINHIDYLADQSEEVANRLSIATIKRAV